MNLKTLLLLVLLASPASAQEAEPFQGIFCDSPEQLQQVVERGIALGGASEGIQAVNAAVKAETGTDKVACVHTIILGHRGKSHSTISTPEGMLDIVPFQVVAVRTPFGMLPAGEDTVWFTLAESSMRGA